MISKRTRRYSQPQERLKQFALNSSKGIDETKAITDSDTVLDAVNMTVNDDGSLSLRPPLQLIGDLVSSAPPVGSSKYVLFDDNFYIVAYPYVSPEQEAVEKENNPNWEPHPAFEIFDRLGNPQSVRIVTDDYYTYERYTITSTSEDSDKYVEIAKLFDLCKASVVNAASDTLFNNVFVHGDVLAKEITLGDTVLSAIDPTLYDTTKRLFPRRMRVSKTEDSTGVLFELYVYTPEVSVIETPSEGVFEPTANLLLDYPYAIRDVYNASVPRIKGIAFYKKDSYIQIDEDVFSPGDRFSQMFESTKSDKYRMVSTIARTDLIRREVGDTDAVVKAFCDIPADGLPYAARWSYSFDGVTWDSENANLDLQEVFGRGGSHKTIDVPAQWYDPTADTSTTVEKGFVTFRATSSKDVVFTIVDGTPTYSVSRPDVLMWRSVRTLLYSVFKTDAIPPVFLLRFEIVKYSQANSGAYAHFENMVATQVFEIPLESVTEYATSPKANAAEGKIIYYKKALYSFGAPLQGNLIYVSDPGSYITPYRNVIDLDMDATGTVVAVVPWREYLTAFTTRAAFLMQPSENGFYTKQMGNSVGVLALDGDCVKAALNGMFLKCNDRIYYAYPNLYASVDNVLQFADVSKPIQDTLTESFSGSERCFATVSYDKYILMVSNNKTTECFIYDLAKRTWEHYKYPIRFDEVYTRSDGRVVASIHAHIHSGDYYILERPENSVEDYCDAYAWYNIPAHDGSYLNTLARQPINFSWDTGQKTDNISETKQFVESKLMFATLSDTDAFPFTLYVAIDGDPHVTKKDIGTDAPFWKPDLANTSDPTLGVLNTSFRRVEDRTEKLADSFNVLRQLVVRYSGKGKSIRHLIEGESQSNFKLYETYVRYKPLSNR